MNSQVRRLERDIRKLEGERKSYGTALLLLLFLPGADMIYLESNFLKYILFWCSIWFILPFIIWSIINLVNLKSRVEIVNSKIDFEIDKIYDKIDLIEKN